MSKDEVKKITVEKAFMSYGYFVLIPIAFSTLAFILSLAFIFDCEFFVGSIFDKPLAQGYGLWTVQKVAGVGADQPGIEYDDSCMTYKEWGIKANSAMDVPLRFARALSMFIFLLMIPILMFTIAPAFLRFGGSMHKLFFQVLCGCNVTLGILSLFCLIGMSSRMCRDSLTGECKIGRSGTTCIFAGLFWLISGIFLYLMTRKDPFTTETSSSDVDESRPEMPGKQKSKFGVATQPADERVAYGN